MEFKGKPISIDDCSKTTFITCKEPKSTIKIGNLEIQIDKVFTNEQKEHIKEYFGFEVKDMCEGE